MQTLDVLETLTPELYQRLKSSLELGRWPSGDRLSEDQQKTVLQALMIWEYHNLPEEQRTGYMPVQCKSKTRNDKNSGSDIIVSTAADESDSNSGGVL